MASSTSTADLAALIWSVADLLRGRFKQSDYGKVILPFTVLRRLDCVLEPTKAEVLAENKKRKGSGIENVDHFLTRKSKLSFYNVSPMTFTALLDDPANIAQNLEAYVAGFSENARDIFERFKFVQLASDLAEKNLLFKVVQKFAAVDMHPGAVSNHDMGLMFENLIRRFAELSNETAGEHYTPREVIRLMVDILFAPDEDALTKAGVVRSFYDPTAGTGGILSVAEEHVHSMNSGAKLVVFGQELNDESYAICKADLLIKGQDISKIVPGNTLSEDGHRNTKFDYMGANPPYGVKWEEAKDVVEKEFKSKGFAGRFGPGLPRINDGSLLFLLHMISKMDPNGSRIGIVFNGSPLFSGDAGSGESEIRRWIIEQDMLEAIIALPTEIFYNTGIATYIWIVTNRKATARKGRVQLIDASRLYAKMKKSLGNKRNYITDEQIEEITRAYGAFKDAGVSKILTNSDFAYRKITVERPLRMSFRVSPDRIAGLMAAPPFMAPAPKAEKKVSNKKAKATPKKAPRKATTQPDDSERAVLRADVSRALQVLADREYMDRAVFEADLTDAFAEAGVKLTAPVKKAIVASLGRRDSAAVVCLTPQGEVEPDTDLRETENVPIMEDVDAFFNRAVKPFVPDAWVAAGKEKIGYEIPFTRYFYRYRAMRPLAEIEKEIRRLEEVSQGAVEGVFV